MTGGLRSLLEAELLLTKEKFSRPSHRCIEIANVGNSLLRDIKERLFPASLNLKPRSITIGKATSLGLLIKDQSVSLIGDIYTDNMTSFLTADGVSDPTPLSQGVKQGCPTSSLLFNIVIDSVLRAVLKLQEYIDIFLTAIKTIGLRLNPAKCYSMHL